MQNILHIAVDWSWPSCLTATSRLNANLRIVSDVMSYLSDAIFTSTPVATVGALEEER